MKTPAPFLVVWIICTAAVIAAPYEPGSGWQEFTFSNTSGPAPILNDEAPFTFTVRADQQPWLEVTDVGPYAGERFQVFNFGVLTGFKTSPTSGENDVLSYGWWALPPGTYSLTFGLSEWFGYSPRPLRGKFQVEILPAPRQVTVSPQSRKSCVGENVSFDVRAEGAEPLTYQWYLNATNLLAGETNSRLNLINLQTNQAGLYSATVSNQFGSATSPAATLLVFDACVEMHLYAGLSITGLVGRTYTLEYLTNLLETNWTALATNTLAQPNWLFIDTNTPYEPKKFFRVRLQP